MAVSFYTLSSPHIYISRRERDNSIFLFAPREEKRRKKRELTQVHFPAAAAAAAAAGCFQGPLSPTTSSSSSSFSLPFTPERAAHTHPPLQGRPRENGREGGREGGSVRPVESLPCKPAFAGWVDVRCAARTRVIFSGALNANLRA